MLTIDPTADPRWATFVSSHPDAQIFHHPAWIRLLKDEYGFRTFAFCTEESGKITAGLPVCEVKSLRGRLRWIALPFSDRCGPLFSTSTDLDRLVSFARIASTEANATLEIRDDTPAASGMNGMVSHWLHVKEIAAPVDTLMKALHPDIRRRIRKCESQGMVTDFRTDEEAMDVFYRLHVATRRRQGVPVQPKSYFRRFYSDIVGKGLAFIAVTRIDAAVLSAAVFCVMHDTLVYKYGASDPAKMSLSSNYLMFWDSMTHAKTLGLRRIDFGKTAMGNEGLRLFKQKWGSEETRLAYSYHPAAPQPTGEVSLSMNLAHKLIQNSPQFVCRLAGELLYRRFAV